MEVSAYPTVVCISYIGQNIKITTMLPHFPTINWIPCEGRDRVRGICDFRLDPYQQYDALEMLCVGMLRKIMRYVAKANNCMPSHTNLFQYI